MSRLVIVDQCAFLTDIEGSLHCLDVETGTINWTHDCFSSLWTTPLITGDHIYLLTEEGTVLIFVADADSAVAMNQGRPLAEIDNLNFSSYFASPIARGGVLYLASPSKLVAIEDPQAKNSVQKMFAW